MTHTDTAPASSIARLLSAAGPRITTWLICVAVLGIVFLPVFVIPYAHHDQYRHFRDPGSDAAFKQNCANDPQYQWLYLLGRPIAAETECVIFEHTTRLSDLIAFRFWVLALLALAATCYAELLRRRLGGLASVAVSLAIFTLPGAQNAVFMTNLANVLAPLLATLSYLALDKAQEQYVTRRRTSAAGWATLAAGLLLAAFLTYPFLALFFLCATLAHLLFSANSGWRPVTGRLLRDAGFCGIIAALYWSIAKLALFPRDPAFIAGMAAAYRPNLDIGGITGRFALLLGDLSPSLLTLWYVYPFPRLAACVLVVMCVGLLLHLWRGNRQGVRNWHRHQLLALLAIILLLVVSAGPFLLIPAPFLFRLFFATGAMMVTLLFWSATQIIVNTGLVRYFREGRERACIGIAICAAGCIIAAINTTVNVQNSFLEFAYVKAQIAAARDGEIQRVHIVQPRSSFSFNGFPAVSDEFNRPTTAFRNDDADLVRLALTEMRAQSKHVSDGTAWIAAGMSRKPCEIRAVTHGQIVITDETGTSSDAFVENGRIAVSGGRMSGVLTSDLMAIRWNTGTIWARRDFRYPLAGDWTFVPAAEPAGAAESKPAAPASIKLISGTQWQLTNEHGIQAIASRNGSVLQVPGWSVSGVIAPNLSQIHWSNGTLWERHMSDEAALEGTWTMLNAYGTDELLVTLSQFGEPVPRSPNMVMIDMNALLDSVWGWWPPPPHERVVSRFETFHFRFDRDNIAAPRKGARAIATSSQTGFPIANLNDGSLAPWGSAEGTDDVYAAVVLPIPRALRQLEISVVASSAGQHLRDISVVAADEEGASGPRWTVLRSRIAGEPTFAAKITVPPLADGTGVRIEIDPTDPNWKKHKIWGFACFSATAGYQRNYLKNGTGIYIRELQVR